MKIIMINGKWLSEKFVAINLFGVVFAKERLTPPLSNHEYIHTLQQREMLFVFFYLWYALEWLAKFVYYRDGFKSYRNVSFEREAYFFQRRPHYAQHRKHFAWFSFCCMHKCNKK